MQEPVEHVKPQKSNLGHSLTVSNPKRVKQIEEQLSQFIVHTVTCKVSYINESYVTF